MKAHGSLYDFLLYRIADRFAEDAHHDDDIEGDLMVFDAAASALTRDDETYQTEYLEITESDQDLRTQQYLIFGAIIRCLRRHGKLDAAPPAMSDEGADWLAT